MARRTRRLWTDEEKRSICLQTIAPGVSVAQVALRYTVNANLIFKWLRDPKYRRKPETGSEEAGLRFLPVEIVKEAPVIRQMPAAENHISVPLVNLQILPRQVVQMLLPTPQLFWISPRSTSRTCFSQASPALCIKRTKKTIPSFVGLASLAACIMPLYPPAKNCWHTSLRWKSS